MESRSFYKVSIGSKSGGKFVWRNDCRKIEGTFTCSLTPVTKSAAQSLSLPPSYSANKVHQYFTPLVSGTPSSSTVVNDLKEYDCTGCTIGGNQFLLTDHTLGLYCVTQKCAVMLLSRMFYFGMKQDNDWYLADGSQFKYGCDPYLKCMYGNAVVKSLSIEANGVVNFTLAVFSKDPSGDTDVRSVYRMVEKDEIYGGLFETNAVKHKYSYFVDKVDSSMVKDVLANPSRIDVVMAPDVEQVTADVDEEGDVNMNYSFGRRENIVHAAGSSDPIYSQVYAWNSVDGTWFSTAYRIVGTVSYRTVAGQFSSDGTGLVPANKVSDAKPESLNKYFTVGWENIQLAPTAFTATTDEYQRVAMTFSAVVPEDYELCVMRDGGTLARFKTGTYSNKGYVDWIMNGSDSSSQYSVCIMKKDWFGWNYGPALVATGVTLPYNPSDVPGPLNFSADNDHFILTRYSWDSPSAGSGFEFVGYACVVTPSDSNGFAKFVDFTDTGYVSVSGGTVTYDRMIDSTEGKRMHVKYRNSATGKTIYSEDGEFIDMKPGKSIVNVVQNLRGVRPKHSNVKVMWSIADISSILIGGQPVPVSLSYVHVYRNGSLAYNISSPYAGDYIREYGIIGNSTDKYHTIKVMAGITVTELGYTNTFESGSSVTIRVYQGYERPDPGPSPHIGGGSSPSVTPTYTSF